MNSPSRKLMALLLIIALSNLATGPTTKGGFEALEKGKCCTSDYAEKALEVLVPVFRMNPRDAGTVMIGLVVFAALVIHVNFSPVESPKFDEVGQSACFREQPPNQGPAKEEPGFAQGSVLGGAELEKISESEYRLHLTAADEIPGFNLKQFLAVEAVLLDEEIDPRLEDPNVLGRAYIQVRGFGHHIREESDRSVRIASDGSPGSVVVAVYGPGEEPEPAQDDWTFSATVLLGQEAFLAGPLEIVQDYSGPAAAQILFQGNSSAVPFGQDFQRVSALVTATADNLPSLSKRVDLFVGGPGLGL